MAMPVRGVRSVAVAVRGCGIVGGGGSADVDGALVGAAACTIGSRAGMVAIARAARVVMAYSGRAMVVTSGVT